MNTCTLSNKSLVGMVYLLHISFNTIVIISWIKLVHSKLFGVLMLLSVAAKLKLSVFIVL